MLETLVLKIYSFTGHRSDQLGGYDMKNPKMLSLKEHLLFEIEQAISLGYNAFLTGGALGTDQAAFWCVEILKKKYPHIKNLLAIPYAEFGHNWEPDQQEWLEKMKLRADSIVYVDEIPEYQKDRYTPVGKHSNYKLQVRNEYLVDNATFILAVWNGIKKRGTWNCLNYAFKKNHIEGIIHLHSAENFKKYFLLQKQETLF